MQSFTLVDLACSWKEAARYLSQRWLAMLNPYLDLSQSSILSARLRFRSEDTILANFLTYAEPIKVHGALPGGFLGRFGNKGESGPLLRLVRSWCEYELTDLQDYPIVQLLLDSTIELVQPLSQFYRLEIKPTTDCEICGEVHLHQQAPLRVHGAAGDEAGLHGDNWRNGDSIAATNNYEVIISEDLYRLFEETEARTPLKFIPVEAYGGKQPLWQMQPQGRLHLQSPPTPLKVRDRCQACKRPLTVALSTSPIDIAFGPERETIYEQEALLTLETTDLPEGDFWVTDLQQGRIREQMAVLQSFADAPDPFYVRLSQPFWLISQRWLRLLHEHAPHGWSCQPVKGLTQ